MIKRSIVRTYTDSRGWQNYLLQLDEKTFNLSIRANGYIGIDYRTAEDLKATHSMYLSIWPNGLVGMSISEKKTACYWIAWNKVLSREVFMTPMKMVLTNKQKTIKKETRGRANVYTYDSHGYSVYYNGRLNYYTKYLSVTVGSDGSISISTATRFVKDLYISATGERYDM